MQKAKNRKFEESINQLEKRYLATLKTFRSLTDQVQLREKHHRSSPKDVSLPKRLPKTHDLCKRSDITAAQSSSNDEHSLSAQETFLALKKLRAEESELEALKNVIEEKRKESTTIRERKAQLQNLLAQLHQKKEQDIKFALEIKAEDGKMKKILETSNKSLIEYDKFLEKLDLDALKIRQDASHIQLIHQQKADLLEKLEAVNSSIKQLEEDKEKSLQQAKKSKEKEMKSKEKLNARRKKFLAVRRANLEKFDGMYEKLWSKVHDSLSFSDKIMEVTKPETEVQKQEFPLIIEYIQPPDDALIPAVELIKTCQSKSLQVNSELPLGQIDHTLQTNDLRLTSPTTSQINLSSLTTFQGDSASLSPGQIGLTSSSTGQGDLTSLTTGQGDLTTALPIDQGKTSPSCMRDLVLPTTKQRKTSSASFIRGPTLLTIDQRKITSPVTDPKGLTFHTSNQKESIPPVNDPRGPTLHTTSQKEMTPPVSDPRGPTLPTTN